MTDGPREEPGPHAEEPVRGFAMADPVSDRGSSASGFLLDALRHRKAGRRALSVLIAALFIAGAGMFTYPFFTDLYTEQVVQERLADEFENVTVRTFDEWQATVEQGRALTKIVLPSLGVETLVVEGTSPAALRAGAGHYPNTPLPGQNGNVAIAGHRTTYGKPFNRIDELQAGQRIWLITPIGDHEYEVVPPPEGYRKESASSDAFITTPKDWQVIAPTPQPSLTLTSCHPKGSAAQRIIVRARLVQSHPPGTFGTRA